MAYELYHHGVLGQKWGVRRYQNKDGTLTAAGKARLGSSSYSVKGKKSILDKFTAKRRAKKSQEESDKVEDNKNKDRAKLDREKKADMREASRHRRALSDDEIKSRISRIKLEKELAELTDKEINKGKVFVTEILSSSSKKAADTILTSLIVYSTKVAAEGGEFKGKDFAAYLAPKKK